MNTACASRRGSFWETHRCDMQHSDHFWTRKELFVPSVHRTTILTACNWDLALVNTYSFINMHSAIRFLALSPNNKRAVKLYNSSLNAGRTISKTEKEEEFYLPKVLNICTASRFKVTYSYQLIQRYLFSVFNFPLMSASIAWLNVNWTNSLCNLLQRGTSVLNIQIMRITYVPKRSRHHADSECASHTELYRTGAEIIGN